MSDDSPSDNRLSSLRKRLGLTQADFDELIGPSQCRIVEAERLATELEGLFRNVAGISKWLSRANPEFDELSPLAIVERGEIDRVWRAIHYLQTGSPS